MPVQRASKKDWPDLFPSIARRRGRRANQLNNGRLYGGKPANSSTPLSAAAIAGPSAYARSPIFVGTTACSRLFKTLSESIVLMLVALPQMLPENNGRETVVGRSLSNR